jgi:predicted tellurium resistance membrane protein TerC
MIGDLAIVLASTGADVVGGGVGSSGAGLLSVESLLALLTLTMLEIVLGIDNIVFLAILTGRVEPAKQDRVRIIGLLLAMVMRILLLLAIAWVMRLTATLATVAGIDISGKDIVLLAGGLFLIAKGTTEIHHLVESGGVERHESSRAAASVAGVLVQIVLMDMIFSLDSVITAVGMAEHVQIMIAAIVIAVLVMMIFAGPIARFVEHHPSVKTLALAFLVLVGVLLVADGMHQHMPRGYVYFAMFFSLAVELLNLRRAAKRRAIMKGSD